jgi:tetratricopeptide (TPR) repeat protein
MSDRPRANEPTKEASAETLAEPLLTVSEPGTGPDMDVPSLANEDQSFLEIVSREHYERAGEFARGGMGRILKALDRRLRRPVALKELHTDSGPAQKRFVREALVTARLQHPSIVPVYEAGRWPDGIPFYAMKLVSGRSLDAVIRENRSLEQKMALLPHVIAVAEAMAYAHSERIIHRDLKPSNVLVGGFGETVVVDWGLAKDLSASPPEDSASAGGASGLETVIGTVMGTPHYMPPEQARGEAVDERADVYALGAMLYYTLAGTPPHAGATAAEILKAVVSQPPTPLEEREPDVPEELCAIVRKAMAPDPKDRYPSAQELAADLKRFETGQLVSVHSYSPLELLRRWLRRHRAAVTVAAVLTAALLAALVYGVAGIRRQARMAAEERDKARLEAAKAEQINLFVQTMLASSDPRVQGRTVTVAQALDEAAKRVEVELADQPEVQAAVRTTIGTTYQGLGLLVPAEVQLRAALESRKRVLGPDHRDVGASLYNLAFVVSEKGENDDAGKLYREALALYGRIGMENDIAAVNAAGELAHVFQENGQYEEAEKLLRDVLAQKREGVAICLNNLGVIRGHSGDWAGAESLHRQSVDMIRRVKGPEHPEVAGALATLASAVEERGDLARAETLYKESLAMRIKLLGAEHPDVTWTQYNYAYMLRKKGDFAGAVRLSRQVLSLRGKTLPDTHLVVGSTLQVLGLSLEDQGDLKGAESALRESLALREASMPSGHWQLATSRSVLGECLARQRRFAEAEPLVVGGYEALKAFRGERDDRTAEALARVVALYEAWKRPDAAATYRNARPLNRPRAHTPG